jgi:hypothetical protein
MYAHRRHYVKQWEHQKPEDRHSVIVRRGDKPVAGIRAERISGVEEEVMYWRKANHIHGWFVENVQDGIDNCGMYYVSSEKLQELVDACNKVIDASKLVDGMVHAGTVYDKEHPNGHVLRTAGKVLNDETVAKELLPTSEGFFFGCTEYNEDYLNDVIETRDWAVRMLEDKKRGVSGDIYYSSSW